MAFNKTPPSFFGTGYVYSSVNKRITLSTNNSTEVIKLSELTNTEANQSTGDARKLVYALMLFIEQRLVELGSSKSVKMTVSTRISNGSTQASTGGMLKTYVFDFYRSNPAHYDVTPE